MRGPLRGDLGLGLGLLLLDALGFHLGFEELVITARRESTTPVADGTGEGVVEDLVADQLGRLGSRDTAKDVQVGGRQPVDDRRQVSRLAAR